MGVDGQRHAQAAFTPGKDPVPIIQEAEWTPGPVWICAENPAPPGFDPRTFQPAASRYTDWAIAAHSKHVVDIKILKSKILIYERSSEKTSANYGPVQWGSILQILQDGDWNSAAHHFLLRGTGSTAL
jgi:hypothetical protein